MRNNKSSHQLSSPFRRQHRRSDRKLPRHAADGLEGVPAAAVRSAGHRGVRRGGSRGFPEETREEQEVLLKERKKRERERDETNCFQNDGLSTFNVKFFSKDCTNVYIFEALRLGSGATFW